jgi:DNA-binding NarL/FixJ family response regulator
MRVLIADDSDLILTRLQDMLSINKHVELVGAFKNGTEALDALRILKPDLAIVDIKMPGLSGLEVLNEIRKEDKKVNFIILTFYAMEYFRQLAFQSGADYFFSKVDDFEELSRVVNELVEKDQYLMSMKTTRN